jgi:hypothetical protein
MRIGLDPLKHYKAFFLIKIIMEWVKVFYNGEETNIEVTRCGRVRRIKKDWMTGNCHNEEVNLSKLKPLPRGYINLWISIKNIGRKKLYVHQLMAIAFLGHTTCKFKIVVDHIDSNKQNNHIDNLRLLTNRENSSREVVGRGGLPCGVSKNGNKYQAKIRIGNTRPCLGRFNTPEEASQAYQAKLKSLVC